jgi:hypothetical protein
MPAAHPQLKRFDTRRQRRKRLTGSYIQYFIVC